MFYQLIAHLAGKAILHECSSGSLTLSYQVYPDGVVSGPLHLRGRWQRRLQYLAQF